MNKNSMAQSAQGGRVVKWKGRTASIAPAMLSVSLVALSSGMGYAETVISTGLTTPQQITTDANVTVTSTGSVTLTDEPDTSIIEIDVDDYTSDFLIDGNLKYTSVGVAQTISGVSFKDDVSGTLTDVSGTLTNNADITLDNYNSYAFATGLLVGNVNLGGVIANNGSILVTATAGGDDIEVRGWGMSLGDVSGAVSNDGSISVTATADGDAGSSIDFRGWGMSLGDVSGAVSNDGSISVTATADGDAGTSIDVRGWGMSLGDVSGAVSNDGSISVTATAGGDAGTSIDVRGWGMEVMLVYGAVSNDGSISVTATADGVAGSGVEAIARGIDTSRVYGAVSNDGSIAVTATAGGVAAGTSIVAEAYGIWTQRVYGALSNDGSISVTATADGVSVDDIWVIAEGISTGNLDADGFVISNDGEITVTATANGTASSGSMRIDARGINLNYINRAGAVSNDGSIAVTAKAMGSGKTGLNVGTYGIDLDDIAANASVSNDGEITVTATADGTASSGAINATANGMKVYAVSGALSNSGSIAVIATAKGAGLNGVHATAWGIKIGGIYSDLNPLGSLSNDGSIVVTATADGTATSGAIYASAVGMEVTDVYGAVSNVGSIAVTATADGTAKSGDVKALAFGMDVDDVYGTLSNDGTIKVTAKAMGSGETGLYAAAYGIWGENIDADGSVSNDGEITVTATADGTASSGSMPIYARGINLNDINGTLSNDGSIAVTAKAMGSGKSGLNVATYGINVNDIAANASVSNDGEITVTATADGTASDGAIEVTANGMVSGAVSGALSNSGSIAVIATAKGAGASGVYATAWGIDLDADLDPLGSLSNDGSIVVTATADGTATSGAIYASAFGMEVSDVYGAVSNDGSITVTAKAMGSGAEGVWATAYGITTNQVQTGGSLSNTGSIIVSAEAKDGAEAYGIDVGTLDGTLYNSGRVLAVAANDGDAYAVKVENGVGSATFTTESLFAGRLSLSNAELTVESVANTPSIFWTFEDIPVAVTLDDANGPKLYSKVTDDGTIIATVEPANLAFSGQIAADMANMGEETVAAMLAATPSNITTDTPRMYLLEPSKAADQGEAFFEGSLVSRKVDDAAGRQMDFDVSSVTAGFVNRLESGLGYGVTISRVNSKGSTASGLGADTVDSSGTVIGTYGNMAFGAASLTFGATLGTLSNSGTRSVNDNVAASGVSTVSAEYGSSFISPSIEASWTVPAGDMTIRPHVGYRYTKLSVDGFTETGGLAAATFGAREVSASDFTIGAEMSKAVSKGTLTGSADILRRVVSDNGASVAFFGETDHTLAANTDFTALELGIGYTMAVEAGEVSIGATSVLSNNGASSYGLAAGYRISF